MGIRRLVGEHRFIVFSVLVLGATALVFGSGMDPQMAPFALVMLPTLAALITAAITGHGELRELGRRITRWRIRPALYLIAIGIPVVGNLLIVALAVATGAPTSVAFSGLNTTALIVPLVVLLPALLEEFGWRGFALPALGRRPLIVSALLVGIPFTLIHLPLHLPGHLNDGLPVWPTVVSVMSLAVIFGWGFAAGGGSALLAGLMHAAANAAVPLTWGLEANQVWQLRAITFAAIALVLVLVEWRRFKAPWQEEEWPGHDPALATAAAT